MNRVPDRYVGLPNVGRPWRPRIDFLARLDYYGDPAPVNVAAVILAYRASSLTGAVERLLEGEVVA